MKLKYKFITHKTDEIYVAVAVGKESESFPHMLELNETARDILELMGKEFTIDSVVEGLSEKYNNVNREYVEKTINDFIDCGIVER